MSQSSPAPAFVNPASTFKRLRPSVLGLLLLGHSVLHFLLGGLLGLTPDEAHYALYASRLALSYYDHPPLVGWVQAPLVALNAPVVVLRLIPELLWVATACLVCAVARRLQVLLGPAAGPTQDAGAWALLAYSLAPLLHLLGIGLVPDSLLMFFTAALLWQTLRLLEPAYAKGWSGWLLLGLLLGLAGLSKYTAIFAALSVLACVLLAHGVALLRRGVVWLALLLALLLVLPVLVWNAQHDWISFAYQLRHGAGQAWRLGPLLVFFIVQVLLYALLILGALALRTHWPAAAGQRRLWGALLSFFALPFAVLAYASGGGSSLPHWTAPAWVALTPWAGLGLAMLWASGRRAAIYAGCAWQGLLLLVCYALMLMGGLPWVSAPAPGSQQAESYNPVADFYGWDQVGLKAVQMARAHHIQHLAVQNWTLASRYAWYARPLPVHVLAPGLNQFSLWSGPLPQGASAVLLDWSQLAHQTPVGQGLFERCEPAQTVPVRHAGRLISHFTLQICHAWGGQPAPRRRGAAKPDQSDPG